MVKCSLLNCTHPLPKAALHFPLPKNAILKQALIDKLTPNNISNDGPVLICSYHFPSNAIQRKDGFVSLKPGILPRLNIAPVTNSIQSDSVTSSLIYPQSLLKSNKLIKVASKHTIDKLKQLMVNTLPSHTIEEQSTVSIDISPSAPVEIASIDLRKTSDLDNSVNFEKVTVEVLETSEMNVVEQTTDSPNSNLVDLLTNKQQKLKVETRKPKSAKRQEVKTDEDFFKHWGIPFNQSKSNSEIEDPLKLSPNLLQTQENELRSQPVKNMSRKRKPNNENPLEKSVQVEESELQALASSSKEVKSKTVKKVPVGRHRILKSVLHSFQPPVQNVPTRRRRKMLSILKPVVNVVQESPPVTPPSQPVPEKVEPQIDKILFTLSKAGVLIKKVFYKK